VGPKEKESMKGGRMGGREFSPETKAGLPGAFGEELLRKEALSCCEEINTNGFYYKKR